MLMWVLLNLKMKFCLLKDFSQGWHRSRMRYRSSSPHCRSTTSVSAVLTRLSRNARHLKTSISFMSSSKGLSTPKTTTNGSKPLHPEPQTPPNSSSLQLSLSNQSQTPSTSTISSQLPSSSANHRPKMQRRYCIRCCSAAQARWPQSMLMIRISNPGLPRCACLPLSMWSNFALKKSLQKINILCLKKCVKRMKVMNKNALSSSGLIACLILHRNLRVRSLSLQFIRMRMTGYLTRKNCEKGCLRERRSKILFKTDWF